MRIGLMFGADGPSATLDDVVATAKDAEARGFASFWMANIFSFDAISTLSIVGRETQRIGVGTAVTPTYPRHPTAIGQQALTAAAATGNRFTLGIGLSHKIVIEDMLGLSYAQPAKHMREYLAVLMPALNGEVVNYDGEAYRVHNLALTIGGAKRPPVLLAALGPAMLKIAGELTDGTSTWMVGPNTMENHIVKRINAAASAAGKPDPTVVGGLPIVLTNQPDAARETIAKNLTIYGQLPSYRAMLDREGATGPADIAIVGDENAVRSGIERFRNAGVTDFNAAVMDIEEGARKRTLDFLQELAGA